MEAGALRGAEVEVSGKTENVGERRGHGEGAGAGHGNGEERLDKRQTCERSPMEDGENTQES